MFAKNKSLQLLFNLPLHQVLTLKRSTALLILFLSHLWCFFVDFTCFQVITQREARTEKCCSLHQIIRYQSDSIGVQDKKTDYSGLRLKRTTTINIHPVCLISSTPSIQEVWSEADGKIWSIHLVLFRDGSDLSKEMHEVPQCAKIWGWQEKTQEQYGIHLSWFIVNGNTLKEILVENGSQKWFRQLAKELFHKTRNIKRQSIVTQGFPRINSDLHTDIFHNSSQTLPR